MNYRFSESEKDHAERLGGNQHRTRQLRRAILYLLTGYKYSELAWYLVDKGLGELFKMAAVRLDRDLLLPHGQPSNRDFLMAALDQAFYNIDPQAPQRKKLEMLGQGLFQGNVPYPYSGMGGYITINRAGEQLVRSAFSTLFDGSYTDVAMHLNSLGYKTAKSGRWNKDAARSFCQNPIHAGYAVTYKDRRPDGSADKRGGMIFTRLSKGMQNPLISLDDFLESNPVMATREIILVVPEVA